MTHNHLYIHKHLKYISDTHDYGWNLVRKLLLELFSSRKTKDVNRFPYINITKSRP